MNMVFELEQTFGHNWFVYNVHWMLPLNRAFLDEFFNRFQMCRCQGCLKMFMNVSSNVQKFKYFDWISKIIFEHWMLLIKNYDVPGLDQISLGSVLTAIPPLVILVILEPNFCHELKDLFLKILTLSVRRTTRVTENTPVDTPDVSPLISRGLGKERSRPNKTQFNEVFYVY